MWVARGTRQALSLTIALLIAVALTACGSSSSHSSAATSSSLTTLTASTTSATSATSASSTKHHRAKRGAAPTTSSSTVVHTSATSATVSTAPPPTPPGTPPAPDGLRQVTGYGSYELCAGQCSGTVPASLRRALHLPHGCPASGGASPVSPSGPADVRLDNFIGSEWRAARIVWVATASYRGPVLIRGRRIDGAGAVGFGEGRVPDDELQLLQSGKEAPKPPGGGRSWLSFTRVRAAGCYAYQVDGTSFSRVIVFRAR